MTTEYSEEFFRALRDGAYRSAKAIVPLVMEFVHPKSVIDLGCGLGTWLTVFRENGVDDFLGVDGDYLRREWLEIPSGRFLPFDLSHPLAVGRRFDLAVCLEVAEHLSPESGMNLVESLARLAPVILFSAAVPGQGGTEHLNEQWPDYWAEGFNRYGFVPVDAIRPIVWNADRVEFWYAQNTLLFVHRDQLAHLPVLTREAERTRLAQLSIAHPRRYLEIVEKMASAVRTYEAYARAADAERGETAEHKARAEFYIAEVDQLKTEIADHKSKAEFYIAEADRLKTETADHKSKAEFYIAGNKRLKITIDRLRRDLGSLRRKATKPTRQSSRAKGKRRPGDKTNRKDS